MELTLLDVEQIKGDKDNILEMFVIKNPGPRCTNYKLAKTYTDYAGALNDLFTPYSNTDTWMEEGNNGCSWWTKEMTDNMATYIWYKPYGSWSATYPVDPREPFVGVRPAIKYSSIRDEVKNKKINKDGYLEVEYGEYPSKSIILSNRNNASRDINRFEKLENLYLAKNKQLKITGKSYTEYKVVNNNFKGDYKKIKYENEIIPFQHIEYEYKNKKYIRRYTPRERNIHRQGEYEEERLDWFEIKPIVWLVDEKNDIAITKDIITTNVPFDTKETYDGNFKDTFMYKYLNNILLKEIQPNRLVINNVDILKLNKEHEKYMDAKKNYIKSLTKDEKEQNKYYRKYIKQKEQYYNILIESAEQLKSEGNNKSLIKSL